MIETLRHKKGLFIPLLLTLLFFLRKGVQYLLIGSYVPALVITTFILLLSLSIRSSKKRFISIARIWAIVILIWSGIRIIFSTILLGVKPLNEQHLSQQFGFGGLLLSIAMFALGMIIIRNLKLKRIKDWL